MSLAAALKAPVKALFLRFPMLDILARRHLWKRVYPRLFFHEPEMRFFHGLAPGSIDVAVDVGAAMGTYCWILERAARRTIAFEPGRIHNRCLTRAARGSRIEVVRAAVGERAGTVRLYTPAEHSVARFQASVSTSNPITRADGAIVEEVPQVSLDDYLSAHVPEGRRVDLIKVDVEGYELEVLKGARAILRRHKPLVICEIEARHNPEYARVFDILAEIGYAPFIYRGGGFVPFTEKRIEPFQLPADLERRLHGGDDNAYVNNFIFAHPETRIGLPAGASGA